MVDEQRADQRFVEMMDRIADQSRQSAEQVKAFAEQVLRLSGELGGK